MWKMRRKVSFFVVMTDEGLKSTGLTTFFLLDNYFSWGLTFKLFFKNYIDIFLPHAPWN